MRVQSRHNFKRRRTIRIAVISLVVVLTGILLPRLMSAVATVVMTPVHAVNVWLDESSSLIPTFFRDRQDLLAQIEDLKQQLAELGGSSLTEQRLWEENNRLRSLLGAVDEKRVAAAVIARPDELPYDLLQIDRGSDEGITVGSPVFIGKDVVIGLVVQTAPHYSFVELVTTAGFEASAFVSGPNIVVPMEGVGGGVARVRVPQGVSLQVGNLVYLPSIQPGVFGRIVQIENQPTQPEQYGYITPDIPLSGLYLVSVGTQSQIAHSATEIDAQVRTVIEQSLFEERSHSRAIDSGVATGTAPVASSSVHNQ